MTNQLSLLLVFALGLSVALSVHGEQPPASVKPLQVALAPIDLWGNAAVETADAISTSLTALLKHDACFEVVSRTSPSVAYVVEGSIQAEPKQRIAALRIRDRKSADLVWSENYDYTNISGDMMARGVFTGLQALTGSYCHADVARTIRAEYHGTADLPDGLAFYVKMNSLSAMNSEDRESAISSVQYGMGLSPAESEQFLDHLLETLDLLKLDQDNVTRDLACNPSRSPPTGDEVFSVFEAMDDAMTTLGARYLASLKNELGRENSARLQRWVETGKYSIGSISFRQKEAWKQTGGNADERLAAICNGLNARPEDPPR